MESSNIFNWSNCHKPSFFPVCGQAHFASLPVLSSALRFFDQPGEDQLHRHNSGGDIPERKS